ncbi:MAG: hypothetical protein ACFE8L_06470 [Candidatus Hodarchaeota archaeon]
MEYTTFSCEPFYFEIQYPITWEVIPGFAGTLLSIQSPLENKNDKFTDLVNIIIVPDLEDTPTILDDYSQDALIGLEREINILKEVNAISDTFLSGFPAKHLSFIHETQGLTII